MVRAMKKQMKNIPVLFKSVEFFVQYESDEDGMYAMHCIIKEDDWIDIFNSEAEDEFHQALALAIEEREKECEVERELSNAEGSVLTI